MYTIYKDTSRLLLKIIKPSVPGQARAELPGLTDDDNCYFMRDTGDMLEIILLLLDIICILLYSYNTFIKILTILYIMYVIYIICMWVLFDVILPRIFNNT